MDKTLGVCRLCRCPALLMLGVMTGLTILGYIVYVLMVGGKYIVLFEMDEEGVTHTQQPKQFTKAKALAQPGLRRKGRLSFRPRVHHCPGEEGTGNAQKRKRGHEITAS